MIRCNVDSSVLQQTLASARAQLPEHLRQTAATLAERLQAQARANLASGGKSSGQLAESLTIDLQAAGGDAVIASLSSNLPYAGYQEYGFQGAEQVMEQMRQITEAFGRPIETPHQILVRAYQRQVNYAGQHFMGNALESMTDEIETGFADTVRQEFPT